MKLIETKQSESCYELAGADGDGRVSNREALLHGQRRTPVVRLLSSLSLIALAGCSVSPSLSVLGAYFPDWMFCFLGGVLLTLILRGVLHRLDRERALGPPVIAWTALLTLFSLLTWLLIFNS